jgi:hypothetical protein
MKKKLMFWSFAAGCFVGSFIGSAGIAVCWLAEIYLTR